MGCKQLSIEACGQKLKDAKITWEIRIANSVRMSELSVEAEALEESAGLGTRLSSFLHGLIS